MEVEQYENDLVYMRYAPITSVDVEGSFFMCKNVLTLNRMSFNETISTKYMVIAFFFFNI